MLAWGGALLLIGGAVIGVPHGTSDFVVGHRILRPVLGRRWLPCFLVVYLALVGVTMAAWSARPLVTLIAFLAISGLHFGSDDMRRAGRSARSGLAFAVRATTPILPIFLLHPAGVSGFIAALADVPEGSVLQVLDLVRWPLLLPWSAALVAVTLPYLLSPSRDAEEAGRAIELLSVALAAVALPPLLAFGLYFCLVHAVRHMLDLADDVFPHRKGSAALLVAAVVLPSAGVCFALLYATWDSLAGMFDTNAVITESLRFVAALTVPHMALDVLAHVRKQGRTADPRCG